VVVVPIDASEATLTSEAMDVRAGSERRRSALVSTGLLSNSSVSVSLRYWCSSASDSLSFYTTPSSVSLVFEKGKKERKTHPIYDIMQGVERVLIVGIHKRPRARLRIRQ
jgi:hypothetical protein